MKKQVTVRLNTILNLEMDPKGGPDIKTNWLTDCRSQNQVRTSK
jgi:hypothetical protein